MDTNAAQIRLTAEALVGGCGIRRQPSWGLTPRISQNNLEAFAQRVIIFARCIHRQLKKVACSAKETALVGRKHWNSTFLRFFIKNSFQPVDSVAKRAPQSQSLTKFRIPLSSHAKALSIDPRRIQKYFQVVSIRVVPKVSQKQLFYKIAFDFILKKVHWIASLTSSSYRVDIRFN